ncbi:MAG: hypothetical protein H5T72_00450 [Actinobacteria bacterium]|nr:hypothetical protein [Actinomycetota bacterium]
MAVLALIGLVILLVTTGPERREEAGDEPLDMARRFMEAVEEEDVDAFMACFMEEFPIPEPDPTTEPLSERVKLDPRRFLEISFQGVDFRFEDVELELRSLEGDSATVVTTSGRLYMNPLGMELVRDLSREPLVFRMVRREGSWYLTENPVPYITWRGGKRNAGRA